MTRIRQGGGRERPREKDLGREGEKPSGERKRGGLILTVGLNQQHLRISSGCQSIKTTEGLNVNQTLGWRLTFLNYSWLNNIVAHASDFFL